MSKTCVRCQEVLDTSLFSRQSSNKDGFKNECKACTKIQWQNRKATLVGVECEWPGCTRNRGSGRLCDGHRSRRRSGGNMEAPFKERVPPVRGRVCQLSFCNNPHWTAMYCSPHSNIAKTYNLSVKQMEDYYANRVCRNQGCLTTKKLHMDHDHRCCPGEKSCGRCVRGWLCVGCNTALGLLQESPERILGLLALVQE